MLGRVCIDLDLITYDREEERRFECAFEGQVFIVRVTR